MDFLVFLLVTIGLLFLQGFEVLAGVHYYQSLNTTIRDRIVGKHNELRQAVQPAASNMMLLKWDYKLAKQAVAYSRTCPIINDKRDAVNSWNGEYAWVGENIYISSNITLDSDYFDVAVQKWFDQSQNYNFENSECQLETECGHYKQLVWAATYLVGCGLTTCQDMEITSHSEGKTILYEKPNIFVCRYYPGGNVCPNVNPYRKGEFCSECPLNTVCKNTTKLCNNSNRITGQRYECVFMAILSALLVLAF